MSEGIDPLQRHKTQVIGALFALNLLFGMLIVNAYPGLVDPATAEATKQAVLGSPLNIAYQALALVGCFAWLSLDSRQLEIRRPWWLNLGVVLCTSVMVPYYLYKTRPEGRRGPAILAFFGVVVGGLAAMMVGIFVATLVVAGTPPATQAA